MPERAVSATSAKSTSMLRAGYTPTQSPASDNSTAGAEVTVDGPRTPVKPLRPPEAHPEAGNFLAGRAGDRRASA